MLTLTVSPLLISIILTGNVDTFESSFDIEELTDTASRGGFFSYIAGTAAVMIHEYIQSRNNMNMSSSSSNNNYVGGSSANKSSSNNKSNNKGTSSSIADHGIYIINYRHTLPMGKGLSSSAAVCVLVAKCFDEVSTE